MKSLGFVTAPLPYYMKISKRQKTTRSLYLVLKELSDLVGYPILISEPQERNKETSVAIVITLIEMMVNTGGQ